MTASEADLDPRRVRQSRHRPALAGHVEDSKRAAIEFSRAVAVVEDVPRLRFGTVRSRVQIPGVRHRVSAPE